jgi:hypothetical protein
MNMQERSEEQILSRLLDLESGGQAARRAELSGQRFLVLIQDPDDGRGYVLRHGLDETEGAEIPPDTEFWEYPGWDAAQQAFAQLLSESRAAGELVENDSTEAIGDSESAGAEVRDRYAASDDDLLIPEDEAEAPETSEP